MPVHRRVDSHGPYYQWGDAKKYYYIPKNAASRKRARAKAEAQAVAIYASGWREESKRHSRS